MLIMMELPYGDTIYAHGTEGLTSVFVEEGWAAIERSKFYEALPDDGGRRPLVLADVTSDADDQFRYYAGTLRDAETGKALTPPITWDVRWLQEG